ncbi:MAG: lysophospholipase [Bacteroidota bacterium]|nr:lysophospholipase [Bacteroidota bacterium]
MKTSTHISFSTIIMAVAFTGCLRLDSSLFNANENKIDKYLLNNYKGEVDFTLDGSYAIPANLVSLFTLSSKGIDELAGTKIYAVYIGDTTRISTDTVIVYCHGNKDHLDFYWPRAQLLANTNGKNRYGVLMVDYRGYGLSDGKPSESGLFNDVDAGLQWLKAKGLTSERLIMYGFSMGSVPATKLTAEPRSIKPSKLILEAPIASADAIVQDASALALPASFFTDLKVNNADLIKKVTQPFMWIHGEEDDFLNINTQGEVVFNNYGGAVQNKYAYRIPGAGHSNVPVYFTFPKYLQAVGSFIRK